MTASPGEGFPLDCPVLAEEWGTTGRLRALGPDWCSPRWSLVRDTCDGEW